VNKQLLQTYLNKACWDEQAQIEIEDFIDVEKFAELIVAECIEEIGNELTDYSINNHNEQARAFLLAAVADYVRRHRPYDYEVKCEQTNE